MTKIIRLSGNLMMRRLVMSLRGLLVGGEVLGKLGSTNLIGFGSRCLSQSFRGELGG